MTDAALGTIRRFLDPELAAMQVLMPDIDIADVAAARRIERSLSPRMGTPPGSSDVQATDLACERKDGSLLGVRHYRPASLGRQPLPSLLFIHGGSFVTGGLHTEDARCAEYASTVGCSVVAVDYRLAPEHPYPAGLDDCVVAARWMADQSGVLGIDPTRLGIGGLSAGGALAAGTALRLRDDNAASLAIQLLLFPVLDARADSASCQAFTDVPVLTTASVETMWRLYLGTSWFRGCPDPPTYSSPAHVDDLTGLPPTYICAAQFDPLRDEALAYGLRLLAQGVSVDMRHYARAFHSFDSFTATRLARAAMRDQTDALRAAFA
ncbi:MAG: acetyl esterase [Frankiales bacterium]|nr:acetyl esterase [Frankiales bacterium]